MIYDLHTHSYASNGMDSPIDLVKKAYYKGLRGLSITDHDTIAGLQEAHQTAQHFKDFELINGIELRSTYYGRNIDILGYYFNRNDPTFKKRIKSIENIREEQIMTMVRSLQEKNIDITFKEVEQEKRIGMVGRVHVANVLLKKKICHSINQCFIDYLGCRPHYVPFERITTFQAITWILDAGGIPILAHPGVYHSIEMIENLIRQGLKGLEVYHFKHSKFQEKIYEEICQKYQLFQTGGSDYHGTQRLKGTHNYAAIGEKGIQVRNIHQMKKFVSIVKDHSILSYT